ncbi:thiamine phosphate synthase [Fictibacillus terranigra]|uniref:Thiamine phosphate synthase n=1 Tax=Fictibacillus terranigra TaxID=3058424 RepID=A0ABT8ECM9_9BACL|nr:thiamine phosphate synthase [Fictibacillus sp. CENA-BCM004]MDN4075604.1 thiamine phosphate synthase [Fictibacillus sp. CENA-BCM004]
MERFEFHVITNGRKQPEEIISAASILAPYMTCIHIREKQRNAGEIFNLAEGLKGAGLRREQICVNDRVDVAVAAEAGAVHLKGTSLEPDLVSKHFSSLRIGKSVHSREEAMRAEDKGVHYLFYGHVFHSESKRGSEPRGLELLRETADAVSIPVVAIGGVTPSNTSWLLQAGAKGIAVMSGIWTAENLDLEARSYSEALQKE